MAPSVAFCSAKAAFLLRSERRRLIAKYSLRQFLRQRILTADSPRSDLPVRSQIRRNTTIWIAHFFAARLCNRIGVLTATNGTETLQCIGSRQCANRNAMDV